MGAPKKLKQLGTSCHRVWHFQKLISTYLEILYTCMLSCSVLTSPPSSGQIKPCMSQCPNHM